MPLAMVRWYDVVQQAAGPRAGRRDVLAERGFIKLRWATEAARGSGWRSTMKPSYQVVGMSSIVRREYVVPCFATWQQLGSGDATYYYVLCMTWTALLSRAAFGVPRYQ